jgi:DNA-binding MarR family transcriptional regulator
MSTHSRLEKVDLFAALRLIAGEPDLSSGAYVAWFREVFSCSTRTAKDALTVLREAGLVEVSTNEGGDKRIRRYRSSDSGRRVLESANGEALTRFARRLFSTCVAPVTAARQKRERASGELKLRFERAEVFLFGPHIDQFAPPPIFVSPIPRPVEAAKANQDPLARLIVEPRCKVCRSPQRTEIDRSIAAGETQANVRRSFNALLGSDYFTANNISNHVRKHLSESDPLLRSLLTDRLDREHQRKLQLHAHLNAIIQTGLRAFHAGMAPVKTSDILRALELREKLEAGRSQVAEELAEYEAFIESVQAVVTPEKWQQVLDEFELRRAEQSSYDEYAKRRRLIEPTFSYLP